LRYSICLTSLVRVYLPQIIILSSFSFSHLPAMSYSLHLICLSSRLLAFSPPLFIPFSSLSSISLNYFFVGLECVGHSFAYVAHFAFLGDIWIRTLNAAVASRCATKLATHHPNSLILLIMHILPKTKINHKMCMYNFEK
jgi:hypothetical protein